MAKLVEIKPSDISEGSNTLLGKGAFDVFMQAALEHIKGEYSAGRITGESYAQAYVSIINNALQVASQFVPAMITANNNIGLMEAQLKQAESQIKLTEAQVKLVQVQERQAAADMHLIVARTDLTTAETNLTKSKLITESAQTNLLKEQSALTTQQKLTEEAQIKDAVNGMSVRGKIGADVTLTRANVHAYEVKQVQDAAKLFADTWTSRLAIVTESTSANNHNMLHDNQIGAAIQALCHRVKIPIRRMSQSAESKDEDFDNPEITGAETGDSDT